MKFYNKTNELTNEHTNDEKFKIKEEKEKLAYKIEDPNKKKIIIISIASVCALLLILFMCTGFALFNIGNNKIIKKVSVKGIDLSGLTKEEAENKINEKIQEKLDTDITLKLQEFEQTIKLSQLETSYDIKKAVEDAYNVGRRGNIFSNNFEIIGTKSKGKNIKLDYSYNEKLLEDITSEVSAKIPNAVVEPNYYIEGNTLIINKGKKGNAIDKEKLKNKILSIIGDDDSSFEIQLEAVEVEPEAIDIDKIYEEVYREAKNAYYTKDPFEIFPHENGIDFDLEAAKELLKEDKEEYEIELTITEPEITTNKIGTEAFPDLISTFTTKYDASNTPRVANLTIAMKKLDGVVIAPGEVFSYNKTLGKRTVEEGYREAGGFSGGRVVQMLGGGICQISSTLYNAVVYANLEILERHNHMFLAGYVGAGRDATVSYGTLDFRFKNTRKYPIMIKTSIGSGVAKVSLFGIKEDVEYEIEISTNVLSYIPYSVTYENNSNLAAGQERVSQNGMNGCKSITYKITKLNGNQVSSEVLSTDTYSAMNKIVQRGGQSVPAEPIPEPTEAAPQSDTQAEDAVVIPESTPEPEPEPTPEPITPQPENPQPDNNTEG